LACYGSLVSTNDEALARARSGDPGRLWITAERQTGGRGRNGRRWISEPGNLFTSLLLIDPAPPQRLPELGFVAGLALAHALRAVLRRDPGLRIKWPNDILHNDAKLAGILLESVALPSGVACVVGIGVNCASHPREALYPATNLSEIDGREVAPEIILELLATKMARWLDVWSKGDGFDVIRTQWLALAAGIGETIEVARPQDTLTGVFRTLDASGRLILQCESGQVAIDAGDVFLAASPPPAVAGA
jgi:BirA family transcriptional regulator, biotin operon repressor / biotin---[acetyl-CoA-carboxylase] ligase